MKFLMKPKDREIFTAKIRKLPEGPKSGKWTKKIEVARCMGSERGVNCPSCSLTSGRSGGVLHVSRTCSQPCGARGAAAHAFGAMRSDTRAATNLKLIAPRDGSVQLNSSKAVSIFDGQAKVLSGVSSGPRVQISPSRPVSFFMVKPRFCPSQVQSIPVKSSHGFWPSPLRSTSCFSPRTLIFGHIGRSPGCDVYTTGPMPYRLDYEYWLILP
ncbi:hypothetical protein F2Q69_00047148 [Brassica cretica]|uniref:Uncharacterized protein n=1 Tax=Brassica cretica TaxID=69181 RepID=A0A8S9PXA2_BRACR|nr:hypothetical protein F2Q69_00047148 [Brassica cretica]